MSRGRRTGVISTVVRCGMTFRARGASVGRTVQSSMRSRRQSKAPLEPKTAEEEPKPGTEQKPRQPAPFWDRYD